MKSLLPRALITCIALAVIGCGGGSSGSDSNSTFSVSGSLTGLRTGSTLTVLSNTVTDSSWQSLNLRENGPFTLSTPVKANGSYAVSVGTQPSGQTCSVVNGSGAGVTANVSNLSIVCSDFPFKVGGTVSGLAAGASLTALNNNGDLTTISSNGPFQFPSPIAQNGSYAVTLASQPSKQSCTVNSGSGAGVISNVSNVAIVCSDASFSLSGAVVGLSAGEQVTLFNNSGDATTVVATATGAASFAFKTPLASNGSYLITVATQPNGKTCTVLNGNGVGVVADVSNVSVLCSEVAFKVSGTLSGLSPGRQLTLTNNAGSPIILSANGPFTFPSTIAKNGSYKVVVVTQPPNQTCGPKDPSSLSRAGVTSDISDLEFVCSDRSLTVSGTVVGLNLTTGGAAGTGASGGVTLLNNGGDATSVPANGGFTFRSGVAYGGSYVVTVATQPTGQICTVGRGTGQDVTSNVTNVAVVCGNTISSFTVAGLVNGLTAGKQVTFFNNASDPVTMTKDGAFRFQVPIASGSSYSVAVGTQPIGQSCSVRNGIGSGVSGNVSNVEINCVTLRYNLFVTVVGLKGGNSLTLFNNGGDALTVLADGTSKFNSPIEYNGSYGVTVAVQPQGQLCAVNRGTGAGVVADVSGITIVCK